MQFSENPYYSPELCKLEILAERDIGGAYEYDKFVVWKDIQTGQLYYDQDAGCSCPTPFEAHDLTLLTPQTLYNFETALREHCRDEKEDYYQIMRKVKRAIRPYGIKLL
jgi:hypothetical protein